MCSAPTTQSFARRSVCTAAPRLSTRGTGSWPRSPPPPACPSAVQKACAGPCEATPDSPLRVRIGLNAGEPVAEDDDLFGSAVQLAARICAQADAGDILVSNGVRELAAGKGFDFSDRGTADLKGFDEPVRLYAVGWQG